MGLGFEVKNASDDDFKDLRTRHLENYMEAAISSAFLITLS